jgi:hypothetical protein
VWERLLGTAVELASFWPRLRPVKTATFVEDAVFQSDADSLCIAARRRVRQETPAAFKHAGAEELDFDAIRKADQVRAKPRSFFAPQLPQRLATIRLRAVAAGRGGCPDDSAGSGALGHTLLTSMTRTDDNA